MLKRIKVRGKLLLLITTPLAAVVVFAYLGIADRTDQASFQEREARIAEFANTGTDLSTAIQIERFRTIQVDHLMVATVEEGALAEEQATTNASLDRWLIAATAVRGDIADEDLLAEIDFMSDRLPVNLTSDRAADGQIASLTSFLSLASESIDDITGQLVNEAADLDLFRALTDYNQLQSIQSGYADVTSIGADALTTGELPIVAATLLEAADRQIQASLEAFNSSASMHHVDGIRLLQTDGTLPSPASVKSNPVAEVQSFLEDPSNGGFPAWILQGEARLIAIHEHIDGILSDATSAALSEADSANQEAQSFLILAGSVSFLALVMALIIGRSISRPLIRLTRNAEQLSSEELPALVESMKTEGGGETPILTSIEVKGRDEVAKLARAISEIQQVTIDVAEEQGDLLRRGIADIFVNLARRNQSLLDRQIDFIDQLENREENPDQLENLFRLDHLATRMRRNAESLLVLAGAEPTRRRGQPVEIIDVMRVAMGEIEDFMRIEMTSVGASTVAGSVAIDLAHLMSELMENATQFSPPDVAVEVVGVLAANGSYELTLSDRGIGMSAEQIGAANETLAEPPIIGLDLSRSLGFTVVSRLAHRLGVAVKLSAGVDGGVTATITVPAEMIGQVESVEPVTEMPQAAVTQPRLLEMTAYESEFDPESALEDGDSTEISALENYDDNPFVAIEDHDDNPFVAIEDHDDNPFAAIEDQANPFTAAADPPDVDPAPPAPSELPQLPVRRPGAALPRVPHAPSAPPPPPTISVVSVTPDHDDFPAPEEPADLFSVFGDASLPPAPPADPERDLFAPLDWPEPETAVPSSPLDPEPTDVTSYPNSGEPSDDVLATRDPAEIGAVAPQVTSAGLIRRTPRKVDVPEDSRFAAGVNSTQTVQSTTTPTANRSPEEVRQMLSRYRAGLRKGRTSEPGDAKPNRRS